MGNLESGQVSCAGNLNRLGNLNRFLVWVTWKVDRFLVWVTWTGSCVGNLDAACTCRFLVRIILRQLAEVSCDEYIVNTKLH